MGESCIHKTIESHAMIRATTSRKIMFIRNKCLICSAAKTRVACLEGKTGMACDGSTTVIGLATITQTYITALAANCGTYTI